MANVSEHWPGVLFIIECKGETADDLSRVYAKDGMYQVVRAQVTYPEHDPEHDPEQMKRPWSKNFTPETPVTTTEFLVLIFSTAALIAYIFPGLLLSEKAADPKRSSLRKTTATSLEFLVLILSTAVLAALTLRSCCPQNGERGSESQQGLRKRPPSPIRRNPPARQERKRREVEMTARAAR